MPARTPQEICQLFQASIGAGELESALSVYDPEAVFVNQLGEVTKGRQGLRQELAPFPR